MYMHLGEGGANLRSILRTLAYGRGGGVKGKIKIVNLIFTDVLDRRRLFCRHGNPLCSVYNTFRNNLIIIKHCLIHLYNEQYSLIITVTASTVALFTFTGSD
jgi:hypothetical protein